MKLDIKYNNTNNNFDNVNIWYKIGEGRSGVIYTINEDYVIKILKNGNRFEYDLYNNFIEIIKNDTISLKIGIPYCFGKLLEDYEEFTMKNKFLIFKRYKKLTLDKIKGRTKVDKIFRLIYTLLRVEKFLENKINCVNLDIKLDNIMLDYNNNIKIIDLGLIKYFTIGDMFYSYNNYIIWPSGKCYLNSVPLYSIFIVICMLELSQTFVEENNIFKLINTLKLQYKNKKLNTILNLLIKKKYDSQHVLNHF